MFLTADPVSSFMLADEVAMVRMPPLMAAWVASVVVAGGRGLALVVTPMQ